MALIYASGGIVFRGAVRGDPLDGDVPRHDARPQSVPQIGVLPLRGVCSFPQARDAVPYVLAISEQVYEP
eukprot:4150254-Lingulodinium_polyedra.AAC.1